MNEDPMDDGAMHGAAHEDPLLRAQLRAAVPEPPMEAVDWSALHGRIMAGAAAGLADARRGAPGGIAAQHGAAGAGAGRAPGVAPHRQPTWWQVMADQAFRGVPLTAGAAAVLALLAVVLTGTRSMVPTGLDTTAFVTVEEALYDGLPPSARPLLLAGVEDGVLLDAALFQAGEEW
jgi:hypothetical protein